MLRKIIAVTGLFIASYAYGQGGSISPYSFFGMGEVDFSGTVANQSMGGLVSFRDSIHVNLKNPASYASLRITNFGVGASLKSTNFETSNGSQDGQQVSFDYLSLAMQASKKSAFGFGILPYSSIGYKLRTTNEEETVRNDFSGNGGVNKVFFTYARQITKGLDIGATLNYNFGETENIFIKSQTTQFSTQFVNHSNIRGWDFNFGINYQQAFKNGKNLYISATLSPEVDFTSKNKRTVSLLDIGLTGNEYQKQEVELGELAETDFSIPLSSSFGLGFGQERKWYVGAEINYQAFSDFNNDFINIDNVTYEDAFKYTLGGYYIPEYNAFGKYQRRMVYRAGFNYGDTGMIINNQEIKNFGISFGVGFPLSGAVPPSVEARQFGKLFSNINLGFEYGSRGTTDAGLVREDYFKFRIGLSLNDGWFLKRKID
ncbi:MAG: hypothetical protein OIF50_01980 [Flavobacteriaceae bacterium]|nr:hypothetical protein [Flavobacteriaceae bacterium]